MVSEKIYFDANIFVAYTFEKHKFHKVVEKCLDNLSMMDMEFCFSEWSILEMIRVLIRDYGFAKEQAEKLGKKILKNKKLGGLSLSFVEIDEKKFKAIELLRYIHDKKLEFKDFNLVDAIHELIMNCNGINSIMTNDTDFNVIDTILAVKPDVFAKFTPKKEGA